jgi:MinD superfamily P-loop ATPase
MVHASLGIGEENSGKLVTTVRQVSHQLAEEHNYDFVLVDGSPGIGCPVIASLTNANLALIVAEPTISAVNDLYRVRDLTKHFQIMTLAIINKADINPELVQEIHTFCKENDITIVGELGYDIRFTKAQIKGQTINEYDPDGLGGKMQQIWTNIESCL